MKKSVISVTLPFFAVILMLMSACSDAPDTLYFAEENGLLVIEAESAEGNPWWEHRHYYTGRGIRSVNPDPDDSVADPAGMVEAESGLDSEDVTAESEGIGTTFDGPASSSDVQVTTTDIPNHISYTVYFDREGDMTVWLLTRRSYDRNTSNSIRVALSNWSRDGAPPVPAPSSGVIHETPVQALSETLVDLGELNALQWLSETPDGTTARLSIPQSGYYTLHLDSQGDPGTHIDKIALVRDGAPKPHGVFIPETCRNCERVIAPQPALPPAWVFGIYYGGYTNQQESRDRVQRLMDEDFPIDAYWIDSWFWDYEQDGRGPQGYMDFIGDRKHYPNPGELWQWMDEHTIKSGIWVWNTILQDSNEVIFQDFLDRGFFSSVYLNRDRWHNQFGNSMTGDIDFSNPEAVAYYQSLLKPFFRDGLDFLKMDRSSSIDFTRANFEATQKFARHADARGYVMAHLHSTYDYRHLKYPTKWTGDAMSDWQQGDYPDMSRYAMGALRENVWMMSNPRLSTYDIPFLTQDTGGYDFFGSDAFGPELYIRWSQFAAYTPVMLYFSHSRNQTSNMPYNFDEVTSGIVRDLLHERMRMFPYRYTYAIKTHETGQKQVMTGFAEHTNQFLYGEHLLVAPVYEKGAIRRDVWLPEGYWYDWNALLEATGGTIGATMREGQRHIIAEAPLSRIPVFVRSGAVIPMREYARSVELGTNDFLEIHMVGGSEGSFELLEDDGKTTHYQHGAIARTLISQAPLNDGSLEIRVAPVQGRYDGMGEDRRIRFVLHTPRRAVSADLNGTPVAVEQQSVEVSHLKEQEIRLVVGFE